MVYFSNTFLVLVFVGCAKLADYSELTFLEKLPATVRSHVLWFCDFEDKSFWKWEGEGTDTPYAGGGIFLTDPVNSLYGIDSLHSNTGRYSAFATIKNVLYPNQKKAVRLMRWTDKPWNLGGDYFPNAAYYSVFMFFDAAYDCKKDPNNDPNNDGGWWNLFQFKSKNNAGSQPVVELQARKISGSLNWILVVKDYPNDNSSAYSAQYILQANPIPIPIRVWSHLEVYYEKTETYTGKVIVWQDNQKIFEKNHVRTVLPPDETAHWGIGNYTDYIQGGPIPGQATLYFDDAVVSTERIGAYLR